MATVQNQKTYESWYESFEGKKEGAFMKWYHSYQGKKIVNIVYSLGASVVIIGALFKIMHFPGAGPVLMTGMIVEAFLFMIGVLEAPHEEFHWANVFPELIEYGSPEERVVRSKEQLGQSPMGAGAGVSGAGAGAGVAGVALSDKEMEGLKNAMGELGKSAGQLAELGKLATVTNKLGEKMEAASEAAAQYAQSATALSNQSAAVGEAYTAIAQNMQGAIDGAKACGQEMNEMNKKIGEINSLYELQLTAIQGQSTAIQAQAASIQAQTEAYKTQAAEIASATEKIKAVGANFATMETSANAALQAQEAFDAAQKKLAQQVADLNKVYGNMLNALA